MPHLHALLLDRDGTLIHDRHYLADPSGVELLPGVGEALGSLAARGMRFFVVSNQSGIGRGFFDEQAAHACNAKLAELLSTYGVNLAAVRFCPHAPEYGCDCRKPGLGMWRSLTAEFGLQPESCGMVGDKVEDLAFGAGAGLALRVLTLTGKGQKTLADLGQIPTSFPWADPKAQGHVPHLIVEDFHQLVQGMDLWSA